jgi:outer membrane murein-binding lipoprotein Lpp
MRKYFFLIAIALLLSGLLAGCAKNDTEELQAALAQKEAEVEQLQSEVETLETDVATLQEQIDLLQQQSNTLLGTALDVVQLLDDQDMAGLAAHVHPSSGVRFSPYSYVDIPNDLVFTAGQIPTLLQDNQIYLWGAYDGTGDPIELAFTNYYNRFVYDQDYANPHMIGNNVIIGTGNTINNIDQAYPNGMFIEFHFTGFDPQYAGMDWRSLNLVYKKDASAFLKEASFLFR